MSDWTDWDFPGSTTPILGVDIEHSGELGFLEDCLAIPGLEGSVLVPVSMRLSRVGSLVGIGSSLLESLLEHRLVEEPGDEVLHVVL